MLVQLCRVLPTRQSAEVAQEDQEDGAALKIGQRNFLTVRRLEAQ
jgi:hypothetical protein